MSLEKLYERLGFNENNGLHKRDKKVNVYPSRINIPLENIDYDAVYNFNDKPLIIFKEFRSLNEEKILSFYESVWNLGETPILFIKLPNEIRIYNGFTFDRENNKAWKNIINELSDELNEFTFLNIVSDNFWKIHESEFNRKKHVQTYLLNNLEDAKHILEDMGLPFGVITSLIGRLLFSRYLIDREILSHNFFHDQYGCNFEQLILNKEYLYKYFRYIKSKFNGDLFPLSEDEMEYVNDKHLSILNRLFKGEDIGTGQSVLFDIYDFSIIPIELISNIYEMFISEKSITSGKVYYTPLFLVDYILNNTLDEMLIEKSPNDCKILDPACGSGVFLVESLRRLIEKLEKINGRYLKNEELKSLLLNNIFGIDKDEDAINISLFSIYLTLLDYQEPNTFEEFKFPKLKNKTLFTYDFFDIESKMIQDIDLIVGNPPWGIAKENAVRYCVNNDVPISRKEIAQCFLARVKDFTKHDTQIALIVTSKILYNLNAKKFRSYFLANFIIDEILEFSSVRRSVFQNAIGPGTIIFYKKSDNQNIKNNVIKHVSIKPNMFFNLFRTIVIEKYDTKFISQRYFIEYDWLWKVMLYGNILDFNFIKRLKSDYKTINDIIDENKLDHGVGFNENGPGKLIWADHLLNKPYLYTDRLHRYFVNFENAPIWNIEKVYRKSKPGIFEPPHILIKKSPNSNFQLIGAYSDQEIIFKEAIMAIKGRPYQKKILKNILGILNSPLFTYYIFLLSASSGVERDIFSPTEIISFPALLDDKISKIVDKLQEIHSNKDQKKNENSIEKRLNDEILGIFNINSVEKDLIDYTINVSIPLFKNQKTALNPPNDDQLKDYAQLFIDHFQNKLDISEFFMVEIYQTDYFIAINFKIVPKKPQNLITFPQDTDINDIIHKMGTISIESIKNKLFIQRDVKGFEKTSFYIIKPNEYKNWHKAVARLDLSEFVDAMIKADIKSVGVD